MAATKVLEGKQAALLAKKLEGRYKDAKYYLDFNTPIDLVVAAILSAQTHDEAVNRLTPNLFAKYKTAADYAKASSEELISYIRSVSFAGNKAKNIIAACKIIQNQYKGKVPDSMEALTMLPGIGRKTANTILINAYGMVIGIPVDTWVIRLSYRLGLSGNKDPDKIESDLKEIIPKEYWHNFAYVLKAHGKTLCGAVPICSKCPVNDICPKNGVTKRS
jgi:endonuclease-3